MRIISSFHDYYDCIQGTIFDKDTIYLRETKNIGKWEDWRYRHIARNHGWTKSIVIVGFARKLYRGLSIYHGSNYMSRQFFWSWEKCKEFLHNNNLSDTVGDWLYKETLDEEWFGEFQSPLSSHFETYKCPIFATGLPDYDLVINPRLKDIGFATLFDPYSAFQTLYQYLCNQASPEKPLPKLDDKTMRDIKGFDKYSFKKEPTKNAKRK